MLIIVDYCHKYSAEIISIFMKILPKFFLNLLHSKYWIIWLGIIVLYLLVLLPYPIIYKIGNLLGYFAMYFMKYRLNIAHNNLELCFSKKTAYKINNMLKKILNPLV